MNNQTPGENISQNNQLSQRKKIDGTPFYLIKQTKDDFLKNQHIQYFLVMGDYRLTQPTETEQETLDKLITEQWLIITNVITIATQKIFQQNQTPYETESL